MMKILLSILKILFIPVSLIYGLIIEIRNFLYDFRIIKISRYPIPVISVGNLTVGGTGKTPVIIMLAGILQERGLKVAIVSRGYGRKSRGVQLISDGNSILAPVAVSGDEAQLIARKLSGVIVAVGEKRAAAIDYILTHFKPQVILMDDAFQHRAVHRDLDIVLWNCRERFYWNLPLPSGALREFQYRIRRGDVFFLTRSRPGIESPRFFAGRPQYNTESRSTGLVDVDFSPAGVSSDLAGEKVVAFAGLAHPHDFETSLRDAGLVVSYFHAYDDHHDYSQRDIQTLVDICRRNGAKIMLCTEKDLVKIRELNIDFSGKIQLLAVTLTMKIIDQISFEEMLWVVVDRSG